MSISQQGREDALLRPLRAHFEQRGFNFFEHPTRELVPPFLGSYRPDAIAYDGSGGGVVIEVKARSNPAASRSLSEIAKLFRDQRDWTFQVLYDQGDPDRDQVIEAPGPERLRAGMRELDSLAAGGQTRAGFLFAWSMLEAIGRTLDLSDHKGPWPARELIEGLTAQGYLDQDSGRELRRLLPLRQAVAHGDLARDVSPGELETMIAQVRGLAAWPEVSEIVSSET